MQLEPTHIRATEDPLGRQSSARRPLQARRFGCIAIRALGCGHWPTHGRQGRKMSKFRWFSRVFAPPSARHAPPRHAARCTHPPVPPRAVGPINFMVLDFSNAFFFQFFFLEISEFPKFFFRPPSPTSTAARAHRTPVPDFACPIPDFACLQFSLPGSGFLGV